MLLIWPAVSLVLWKRLDPARALIWTILGGYLIMPQLTAINLPVLPDLDKVTIPNLAALFGAKFVRGDRFRLLPTGLLGRMLVLLFIFSPIGTVLTNGAVAVQPGVVLPAFPTTDIASMVIGKAIDMIPFLLARHYLGNADGNRAIIEALVLGGLIYSLPILLESALSPQLHRWIYGFHQHDFFQTMRQGGYRPMVFLEHGLWVAFFTLMALLSALVRVKTAEADTRARAIAVFLYLGLMLMLCKSAGVLVYAVVGCPLIFLTRWRMQVCVAAVLATMVTLYPVMRGAHLVPVEQIVGFARGYSEDRADSLKFRFDNEELLLAHAQERGLFGWGGYERNLLHNPDTGETSSIADGGWIIALGNLGWAGFAAFFGLASLPLWSLGWRGFADRSADVSRNTAGLTLILALGLVDLLPNATHVPFDWLIAGALLGVAEALRQKQKDVAKTVAASPQPRRKRTVI